ncbi:hypothetical protein MHB42_05905 [Lysinibacillus sp. FSL K6-0232]|uniref:hypothetical protein n=1 Tax=unclassified Lysinibacillus TaxID=2636778 RepID=UPI0030F714C0
MLTNQQQVAQFLKHAIVEDIYEQFNVLVWIDWREAEEDVIAYFNEQLPITDQIACKIAEIDKPRGVDIVLTSQEKMMTIPFADDRTDRDSAIRAMQDMLSPRYQIRWFMESLGDDTLAFVLLPARQWKELEQQFGKRKVDYYFQPVTNSSVMFELDIDEVMAYIQQRDTERPNI